MMPLLCSVNQYLQCGCSFYEPWVLQIYGERPCMPPDGSKLDSTVSPNSLDNMTSVKSNFEKKKIRSIEHIGIASYIFNCLGLSEP